MNLEVLIKVLDRVQGCTFATIDSVTEPSKGIEKVTTGERVLLFNNLNSSGYENMVKRRLIEAGKDPRNFSVGDPPWGERLPNSPLIVHNGRTYLQTIELKEGAVEYFTTSIVGRRKIEDISAYNLREHRSNQGLPKGEEVKVKTYKLESIERIALMGEILVANNENVLPLAQ